MSDPAAANPSVLLESRYRKLTRDLPQTIFFCPKCRGHRRRRLKCSSCEGFGKLTRESVQELIAWRALPAFNARKGKFHGAGREDIDVRMLGRGRPFIYEVQNPKRTEVDLDALAERINRETAGKIEVEPFHLVARDRVGQLKEAHHRKRYGLLVQIDGDLAAVAAERLAGGRFALMQRTPQRVAHRRADLERHRDVEVLAVAVEDSSHLRLEIECAHGTYVKEWVSGDDGRCVPSVSDLCEASAQCVELDVLDIVDTATA